MYMTHLDKQSNPEETRRKYSKMAPIDKIGNPEEIVYPALFLASDAASFVTGFALPVDGGYSANGVRRII
jgi:NAD(P)-dependent dehydrogenase (short-subunit alcohol dehydrogenase family)